MTRDDMLAYLQEAARDGRIDASVYQVVRDYISDAVPNLSSQEFNLHNGVNQVYNMNVKGEMESHQEV
jgi:hypothetical protein